MFVFLGITGRLTSSSGVLLKILNDSELFFCILWGRLMGVSVSCCLLLLRNDDLVLPIQCRCNDASVHRSLPRHKQDQSQNGCVFVGEADGHSKMPPFRDIRAPIFSSSSAWYTSEQHHSHVIFPKRALVLGKMRWLLCCIMTIWKAWHLKWEVSTGFVVARSRQLWLTYPRRTSLLPTSWRSFRSFRQGTLSSI